eukprot:TRINITY_DN12238_c0_g1_i3.p1 TRINITY_DN12238_c0_g1~~TRINITY_DN12238_c0_g1_i3.p1  ORF type:complete len:320 (+),score=73.73 TRINITY_DN12238_c0_g1_i3:995-1954(+)
MPPPTLSATPAASSSLLPFSPMLSPPLLPTWDTPFFSELDLLLDLSFDFAALLPPASAPPQDTAAAPAPAPASPQDTAPAIAPAAIAPAAAAAPTAVPAPPLPPEAVLGPGRAPRAVPKLAQLAQQLGVETAAAERALELVVQADQAGLCAGLRTEDVAAAALLLSLRDSAAPDLLLRVADAAKKPAHAVEAIAARLAHGLGLGDLPACDPTAPLDRWADALSLGGSASAAAVVARARARLQASQHNLFDARVRDGVCAAALWAACGDCGVPQTRDCISTVTGVCLPTLRRRIQELHSQSPDSSEPDAAQRPTKRARCS